MGTHRGRWWPCCGLGKGWHRKHHKGQRQRAKREIANERARAKEERQS